MNNNPYIQRLQNRESFESIFEDSKHEIYEGIQSGEIQEPLASTLVTLIELIEENGPINNDLATL